MWTPWFSSTSLLTLVFTLDSFVTRVKPLNPPVCLLGPVLSENWTFSNFLQCSSAYFFTFSRFVLGEQLDLGEVLEDLSPPLQKVP